MVRFAQQAPYQVIETPLKDATVTVSVAEPHPGVVAVMVAVPGATAVTGMVRVEPAVVVSEAGTVATLGLLEIKVTVTPAAGAGEKLSVRSCVEPAFMVIPLKGERKLVPAAEETWTCVLADVNPGADAVITAVPALTPLMYTGVCAKVFPAEMKSVGVTVATAVLLLASETVTPPAGAPVLNITESVAAWFTPTVKLAGREMAPDETAVTVTVALAPVIPGALAAMLAVPAEMPVTATETLVTPAPKLTVAGTVATPGLLELKFTASADGRGAESCNTRSPVAPLAMVRFPGEKLNAGGGGGVLPPVTCTGALADG